MRAELEPDDRVFAPDRFSDWMLFKIPELRGRIAYDVRFELYDEAFYDRPPGLRLRDRPELEVVRRRLPDRPRRRDDASRTPPDFLAEPGRARHLPRRRAHRHRPAAQASQPASRRNTSTPSRSNTFAHARIALEARDERSHDLGMPREDRRVRARRPTGRRDRRRPTSPGRDSGRSRRIGAPRDARRPCSTSMTAASSGTEATAVGERRDSREPARSRAHRAASRRRRGPRADARARASPSRRARRPRRAPAAALAIRAIPNTVAAIRNGITAATLWYRGSVIDRKSDSPFARSCGSATSASPGESTNRKSSGSPSQTR